ncbi:MAG: flagellar hook protein FlgE [Selenomonadaceae bacterium]|nr:flagellar hook protein FlgE [Selenomonadaceae bacterium]
MMRSLYTGLSGLKTHQTKMDVIGNNISNVNTTGFKAGRATFADMLSQNLSDATASHGTVGSTNPKQIGLGDNVSAIDTIFKDGTPLITGKNTDLCISGDGLFVVQKGNDIYYTRDGAFEFDAAGNYVLPGSGHFVQGWTATDGVINTTGAIGNITVAKGQVMEAKPTTEVDYYYNLSANVPMVTGISGGEIDEDTGGVIATDTNPASITLSDGTVVLQTSGSYKIGNSLPITASATVYDSLGNTHEIPVYFVREGNYENGVVSSTNKWLVSLSPNTNIAKGDVTTAEFYDADGNPITATLNAAEIQFDSAGNLVTSAEEGSMPDITGLITLNFPSSGTDTGGAAPTDPTDPTAPTMPTTQNVTLDFAELTQFASGTTVSSESDGNTEGVLKEIQIDNSGVITGIYTNNVRRAEAQVALAHFTNSAGLTKTGTSLYRQSDNSGVPMINSAAGFGVTITPSALEMSNVDVANEFADMIITQRGFQSNSKVVTVGDEMIETAINMKR